MRLVALVGRPLAEGFGLLGFETVPDAGAADVEQVLGDMVRARETALVVLDQALARGEGPVLARVRREGGHIVVVEVPPLEAPADYEPPVEALVRRVLGVHVLEEQA